MFCFAGGNVHAVDIFLPYHWKASTCAYMNPVISDFFVHSSDMVKTGDF